MRTLTHHPRPLYSLQICSTHELSLTPPDPLDGLNHPPRPWDHAACARELLACVNAWRHAPSPAFLARGPASPREVLFWLEVMATRLAHNSPYQDLAQIHERLPASRFDALPEDSLADAIEAAFEALQPTLHVAQPDALHALALLLLAVWPPAQGLTRLVKPLRDDQRAIVLLRLAPRDPALARELAQPLLERLEGLDAFERPPLELAVAMILDDEAMMARALEQDWEDETLSFTTRTLAMEATARQRRWEDFCRLAYHHLPVSSPLILKAHLAHFGTEHLEVALEHIANRWSATWGGVFAIHDPRVTGLALELVHDLIPYAPMRHEARRWLHREGANAIAGALDLWDDLRLGIHARALIQDYISDGHGQLVESICAMRAPHRISQVRDLLDAKDAASAQASQAPIPDELSALRYWMSRGMRHPIPEGLLASIPHDLCTTSGHHLGRAQIEGVLRLLQDRSRSRASQALDALTRWLDKPSRQDLARILLLRWIDDDQLERLTWCVEGAFALLPEGVESLYVRLAAELDASYHDPGATWREQARVRGAWSAFIERVAHHHAPSRMVMTLIERSPRYARSWHPQPPPQVVLDEAQRQLDPPETLLERLLTTIIACDLSRDERATLYHRALSELQKTHTLSCAAPRWMAMRDAMARAGLGLQHLWTLQDGARGDDASLTWRLDADGSALDVHDEPVQLPQDARVMPLCLDDLDPSAQALWGERLMLHQVTLLPPGVRAAQADDQGSRV